MENFYPIANICICRHATSTNTENWQGSHTKDKHKKSQSRATWMVIISAYAAQVGQNEKGNETFKYYLRDNMFIGICLNDQEGKY